MSEAYTNRSLAGVTGMSRILTFSAALSIVGLVYSRAMISIGMIGMVLSFFWYFIASYQAGQLNFDLRSGAKRLATNKYFLFCTLVFWQALFGLVFSADLSFGVDRVILLLPFLFIPLIFGFIPALDYCFFETLLWVFFATVFTAIAYVTVDYLLHLNAYSEAFLVGKPMPTPVNHIRFSLMLVIAAIFALEQLISKYAINTRFKNWVYIGLVLSFVGGVHLIAARTGVVVLYASTFCLLALHHQKFSLRFKLMILAMMLIVPSLSYFALPSVQNKVKYTIYDFKMSMNDQGDQYNDGGRLNSYEASFDLIKSNLIFGVGTGDLKDEVELWFHQNKPHTQPDQLRLPHNQFLWVATSNGLFGLFLFCVGIFSAWFYRRNALITCFYLIFFLSFLVEPTLEGQIGTALFTLFYGLLLNQFNE